MDYRFNVIDPVARALGAYQGGVDRREGAERQEMLDARYLEEQQYNRGRQAVADQRYLEERDYNRGRQETLDDRATTLFGQQQQDRAAAQAAAEAQAARQAEYARRVQMLDGSAQSYHDLARDFPQLSAGMMEAFDTLDASRQAQTKKTLGQTLMAINSGDSALARSILQQQADALRSSGEENTARMLEALTKFDDGFLKDNLAIGAASLGITEFDDFLGDPGSEQVRASKILYDGTTVTVTDSGTVVRDRNGNVVEGPAAAAAIQEANEADTASQGDRAKARGEGSNQADIASGGEAAASIDAAKDANKLSLDAFGQLGKVASNRRNLERGLQLIEDGAQVGPIAQYFPAVNEATRELLALRNDLGLDVVGAVTFGALSEGELELAMSTALPTNMNEDQLKEWLQRKVIAQKKLEDYLYDQARFLSEPGNTLNDWLKHGEEKAAAANEQTSAADQGADISTAAISGLGIDEVYRLPFERMNRDQIAAAKARIAELEGQ